MLTVYHNLSLIINKLLSNNNCKHTVHNGMNGIKTTDMNARGKKTYVMYWQFDIDLNVFWFNEM